MTHRHGKTRPSAQIVMERSHFTDRKEQGSYLEVLKKLKEKFPHKTIDIHHDTHSYQPEEELQLIIDKIMSKLD